MLFVVFIGDESDGCLTDLLNVLLISKDSETQPNNKSLQS